MIRVRVAAAGDKQLLGTHPCRTASDDWAGRNARAAVRRMPHKTSVWPRHLVYQKFVALPGDSRH
jgi:hypothetical protein